MIYVGAIFSTKILLDKYLFIFYTYKSIQFQIPNSIDSTKQGLVLVSTGVMKFEQPFADQDCVKTWN